MKPRDMYARAKIVRVLQDNDGRFVDEEGFCNGTIAAKAGLDPKSCSTLLRQMELDGEIVRDSRGRAKRTFEIVLVDVTPYTARLLANLATLATLPEIPVPQEPEPEPTPEPEPVPADPDAVARAILRQVATLLDAPERIAALEAQATEVVNADRLKADHAEMSQRLAMTLDENQRLRVKRRELEDLCQTQKNQIETLRRRVADLEYNLKQAMQDNRGFIDVEVNRRIARFMEERPRGGNGDD